MLKGRDDECPGSDRTVVTPRNRNSIIFHKAADVESATNGEIHLLPVIPARAFPLPAGSYRRAGCRRHGRQIVTREKMDTKNATNYRVHEEIVYRNQKAVENNFLSVILQNQTKTLAMGHLKIYNREDILSLTKLRKFETKLGERLQIIDTEIISSLKESEARFVLVGIPEDIGIKANWGIGGADSVWLPFLQRFLNIQSNDFLDGSEILLLGHFDFGDIQYLIDTTAKDEEEKIEAYRRAVNVIDDEVECLIKSITEIQKIPIAIGGGHNNAYPLIKGAAKGWYKAGVIPLAQINCINLDAHADYGPVEGRHNGNPFRYAEEDGYLQKYCVIGIQENSLKQNVWIDIVNNPFIDCITFEDIFVHEKRTFMQAVAHAAGFTEDTLCGIELDLDSIQNILSSAISPVGVSPVHARQYVSFTATDNKPAYLHICEGATRLADGRTDEGTGKLISYLVSDFVKAMNGQK